MFIGNESPNTEEGAGVSGEGGQRDEELLEGHKRLDGKEDGGRLTTILTYRSFFFQSNICKAP